VRAGVNINLVTDFNVTPLVEALRMANEEAATCLLSKNVDISLISPVYSGALHLACSSDFAEGVKW
jgi:hypothetical protein